MDFQDGASALEYIRDNPGDIELIISDWEMPQVNGLELLRSVRSDPALEKIPFLMITSQNSMERMKVMRAAQSQVDQYLLKPFRSQDIKERIDEALERSRNRTEVDKLMHQAREFIDKNLFDRAIGKLEQAGAVDPKDDTIWRVLGEVLHKAKGPDHAISNYRKAVKLNPYRVENYLKDCFGLRATWSF